MTVRTFVPSALLALVLNACAIPSNNCTKSSGGWFGGTVTIDYDCGDTGDTSGETGVIDTNDTGDTDTDSDTDTDTDTDTDSDTDTDTDSDTDTDTDTDTDSDSDSDTDTDTDTDTDSDTDTDDTAAPIDNDGDGFTASDDCDDADAAINPGATEICDGVDNNCDTTVDSDAVDQTTYYADVDGDGYGDVAATVSDCSAPAGYVADSTDCDDTDSTVYPYAVEDCAASIDLNCDGSFGTVDADGDGVQACDDCNDAEAASYPGNTEVCDELDNDCNGDVDSDAVDMLTWYMDADSDSYGDAATAFDSCDLSPAGATADNTDCDDGSGTVNPGASESCNGVDDDCNGVVDNDIAYVDYYVDADIDGYGAGAATSACVDPGAGYSTDSSDCDDSNANVNPSESESCNDVDDNCDGSTDEGLAFTSYYADADSDGYGDSTVSSSTCDGAPSGTTADNTDCDDSDSGVNPGEFEICNSVDDDCNGSVDDSAVDALDWYRDADNDGYGNASISIAYCTEPSGYTADATDCDDSDNDIYPGNIEWCDGKDNDCSGASDDGDYDADGYEVCDDCDDGDASLNPGEPEVCDGDDNDCDGVVDDGLSVTYYLDDDGDGYGNSASSTSTCSGVPAGHVVDSTDCDDSSGSVYPGATEACNSMDDDCDGATDEGVELTFYLDNDGDGYGDASVTDDACSAPAGYVVDDTDCDDTSMSVYPGAPETCDSADDDCDGSVDEDLVLMCVDGDGDTFGDPTRCTDPMSCLETAIYETYGYVEGDADCDDTDAAINPDATEVVDGIDNDCDSVID